MRMMGRLDFRGREGSSSVVFDFSDKSSDLRLSFFSKFDFSTCGGVCVGFGWAKTKMNDFEKKRIDKTNMLVVQNIFGLGFEP